MTIADPNPPTAVRIGIDVGGTFTKGVALDGATHKVLARQRVATTHAAAEGVVAGVLQVLDKILDALPEHSEVALVAHATTQATNALLEGDMARVGILALGPAAEEALVRKRTRMPALQVGGRSLGGTSAFVATDTPDMLDTVREVVRRWCSEGIEAVAVSHAFAVDDPSLERAVAAEVRTLCLPATAGSDLSGVYGLEMRSGTAAINASILPTMLRTAHHVEDALARRLPGVPLLVVRGDGGAVDLRGLREAPIQTIVSGPAASLAGAVLHNRVSDGVFFEVGGTSTNIGAIKGGRPVMKYMTVMDFPTALRAADIRIAGVAGGSLVRLSRRRIEEVGPRSAHIARLPYACFADPSSLEGAQLRLIAPRPGDSEDYAVLESPAGRFAITPTCAANALGLLPAEDAAAAPPEAARAALAILGRALGASADAAANAVLEAAAEKLTHTVKALVDTHRLRGTALYGGGGGARVLGPVVAKRLGMHFDCLPNADIISSIGAALTLIRVERERSAKMDDPTVGDLLLRDVESEAVRLGADPGRLQTEVRYLPEERLLRAVAFGSHAIDGRLYDLDDAALRALGCGLLGGNCALSYVSPALAVVTAQHRKRTWFGRRTSHPTLVLDRRGGRLLEVDNATVMTGTPTDVLEELQSQGGRGRAPHVHAVTPRRLVDCSHLTDPEALFTYLRGLYRLESSVAAIVREG